MDEFCVEFDQTKVPDTFCIPNRLEAALEEPQNVGQKPSEEMKYLAGLTRVQYVFYYPDTKDIVIAGPAEGWGPDRTFRVGGTAPRRWAAE